MEQGLEIIKSYKWQEVVENRDHIHLVDVMAHEENSSREIWTEISLISFDICDINFVVEESRLS